MSSLKNSGDYDIRRPDWRRIVDVNKDFFDSKKKQAARWRTLMEKSHLTKKEEEVAIRDSLILAAEMRERSIRGSASRQSVYKEEKILQQARESIERSTQNRNRTFDVSKANARLRNSNRTFQVLPNRRQNRTFHVSP